MMMPPPPPPASTPLAWPLDRPVERMRYRDTLGNQRPAQGKPVRHHAGIDLGADFGEVVRAVAPGRVLTAIGWQGNAKAIIVGNRDVTILYGAVAPDSWQAYGVSIGDDVRAGQPIASIGMYPDGSTMLHISAHAPGTRDPERWWWGKMPPADLRDVRPVLDAAAADARAPAPQPPAASSKGWPDFDELLEELKSKLPSFGPAAPPPPPPPPPSSAPVAGAALALVAVLLLWGDFDR